MVLKSYDSFYVDDVSQTLGMLLEYAKDYEMDIVEFWQLFINSKVAKEIENGNPKYVSGLSAIEIFREIVKCDYKGKPIYYLSEYYWTGWIVAQYQNIKVLSFSSINKFLPIDKIISLYNPLHEADVTKFFDVADQYFNNYKGESNLRKIRTAAGLSQSQLASLAEVSIRSIQMYEQRQNDINKAQVDILFRISKILGCKIEDLLDY